jgi:hypothetical protein
VEKVKKLEVHGPNAMTYYVKAGTSVKL